jgi:D-psicose/D-tagatose/L-ribulose 3-epimerase
MIRLGINTFLFASPFTNDSVRLFPRFRAWGFETVEIAIEDPSHIDPAFIRKQLERHGLVCGSVCACMGPDRDLRGTALQQRTAFAYLKALLGQMEILGCPRLIGPVYSSVGRADAETAPAKRRQWKLVVGHLRKLCRLAEERGQQICLEPLNRFETDFINTCDQGLRLIAAVRSPALKLHLDTFHMNIEEKSQANAIRRAGKHLGHLHAAGSDRGTPGNDHIDWPAIAKSLRAIGYAGDIVIESFTPDVKVIARAAAIWRRIEPARDDIAVEGRKFLARTLR